MRTRFRVQAVEDLSVFSAFCARPGLKADSMAAQRVDRHLVVLDPSGALVARCSLWWRSTPLMPGRRTGVIGHYGAVSAAAGWALLRSACRELAARGCTMAAGPMDGNTWRSYRLVTRTSRRPAFFLEPGFPLDWAGQFEDSGFRPLARYFSVQTGRLEGQSLWAAGLTAPLNRRGIRLRLLDPERFEEEVDRIYPLCLESFKDNFFFTAIRADEFAALYRPLRPYLSPALSWVAELRGKVVGFVIAFPDILQAQRGEAIDTVILKTIAVAPELRGIGLGRALVATCQSAAAGRGYRHAIHALIREGNPSQRLSGHLARPIRSYVLFAKKLV